MDIKVLKQAQQLAETIHQSETYVSFKEIEAEIKQNLEAYQQVNAFRQAYFEAMAQGKQEQILAVETQYKQLLDIGQVRLFLEKEHKLCAMMRAVYENLDETVGFDMSFLRL